MTVEQTRKAEARLGISFDNKRLLEEALTHSSVGGERDAAKFSNERLEFLGDSVLSIAVTDFLFRRFPSLQEGDLAKLRASLVKADELAKISSDLGLGECLILGKGAEASGGRGRVSILEACFEAVVGAIYLDKGLETARKFVIRQFKDTILARAADKEYSDFKTLLQELTMERYGLTPDYRLLKEEGPVHDRSFFVEVAVDKKARGSGWGKSKKQAEQAAAQEAWESILAGETRETPP